MGAKVRKGDRVHVFSGKDAGKEGRVIAIYPDRNRALIEGINRVTRHEKVTQARGRSGQTGGITQKELSVDLSGVGLICKTDGPTRVGFRTEQDGLKVRICRKCGAEL